MNPDTNRFEALQPEMFHSEKEQLKKQKQLKKLLKTRGVKKPKILRPDGTEVPEHWSVFQIDKNYVINNYTFKCKYIGETSILFEPVGVANLGGK